MSVGKRVRQWVTGSTPRQQRARHERAQWAAYKAARRTGQPAGALVSATGRVTPIKSTGNPLLDSFHGIGDADGELSDSPQGLARAYLLSVLAYRCIKVRAQTLASIPLQVMTLQEEPLDNHPLTRLFSAGHSRLMYTTETDMQIWGTCYWTQGARGKPKRQNPQTMEVVATHEGIEKFVQRIDGQVIAEWDPRHVTYFYDFNPDDDLSGRAPLAWALRAIGTKTSIEKFAQAYFDNDATPGGLLTTDQRITEAESERVEKMWKRLFQGADKAHSTAILFGGLQYQVVTPALKDLVMSELREDERREIASAFGVPLTIALATDAANYATSKEQRQSFYTETILPELDLLLDTINHQLVPQFGIEGVRVVANLDNVEVLQEDRTEITQRNAQATAAGYMSFNEAREREGLDPLPQDLFVIAGKPVLRQDLEAGDLSTFEAPAASPFGFSMGGLPPSLPEPEPERRQLPAPANAIETVPSKSIIEVVVRSHDPQQASDTRAAVVRDTMLTDLERWQRKIAKKGVYTPFSPDYLPDAVTAWVRADLDAWDGDGDRDDSVKRAFELAAATIKADDPDLATPEEFEAYWRGIDRLFGDVGDTFEALWRDLPTRIADAMRTAGATGAEFDLQAFLDGLQDDMVTALAGSERDPGALARVFLAGAARGNDLLETRKSVKQGSLTISWELVNQLALEWARGYAADLVRGVNATTLDTFRTKIADWMDAGGTLEDLAKYIEGDLAGLDIPAGWSPGKVEWATSRARARLIAQTETTRAFHEGAVARWKQAGVTEAKWRTNQDAYVCPICRPLNNTIGTLDGGWQQGGKTYHPPAHPGCRCFASPVVKDITAEPEIPMADDWDITQYQNRNALEFARELTPDRLNEGQQGDMATYMYSLFRYTNEGRPTFSADMVQQNKIDLLYNVHTMGRGQVHQRHLNEVRQQAAGILAADEHLDRAPLSRKERNILTALASSDDDAVAAAIDRVRDQRLRGRLAQTGPQTRGPSRFDKFVSAQAEEGAARLREYATGVA